MTESKNANLIYVDVVIIGGGAAGLWLLDDLVRDGYNAVLLEAFELGSGQTIASQGIIHGGLKYTLTGMLNSSAKQIREMPGLWRSCMTGDAKPDLTHTRVRSEFCYLWRTESLKSRFGMVGAKVGLVVKPNKLDKADWPEALRDFPGEVFRLDEQVIAADSFIADLAKQHESRILKIDVENGFRLGFGGPSPSPKQPFVELRDNATRRVIEIECNTIVLTAGRGNAMLRQKLGLKTDVMQRRPLHMTMVRGRDLPFICGHCVDGSKTRVTITADHDSQGRVVWQVGGQVSEVGVNMTEAELLKHVKSELHEALPGVDLSNAEFATYKVDRAELGTGGSRPDDATILQDGPIITAWPTKLALAPRLSEMIRAKLSRPIDAAETLSDGVSGDAALQALADWPRPEVAKPLWETTETWIPASSV